MKLHAQIQLADSTRTRRKIEQPEESGIRGRAAGLAEASGFTDRVRVLLMAAPAVHADETRPALLPPASNPPDKPATPGRHITPPTLAE